MGERGILISFEGPDGAGKTSVLKVILERLKPVLGDRLLVTREPGGNNNPLAESIRDMLLSSDYPELDDRTEVLLFAAARRQHLVQTILPALADGKIVISDRYLDSSIAYQGGGREIGVEKVMSVNEFATEGVVPDYTIYFDVKPEVGIQRINSTRTNEINRLDQAEIAFHKRVSNAYLDLVAADPGRFRLINAEINFDSVVEETWQEVKTILQL
ncbi:dTMP kinase [Weissella paramesenteroides]|uniref:dTMP kinase n=1 Tax=Weissella paramesenteroides TaxID=1249 RepID=UPI002402AADC|nr:dTMP kinase [Weissella paramesenteroides]MDF8366783.1 dTMP kinase [Weissella paramesenteroides]